MDAGTAYGARDFAASVAATANAVRAPGAKPTASTRDERPGSDFVFVFVFATSASRDALARSDAATAAASARYDGSENDTRRGAETRSFAVFVRFSCSVASAFVPSPAFVFRLGGVAQMDHADESTRSAATAIARAVSDSAASRAAAADAAAAAAPRAASFARDDDDFGFFDAAPFGARAD